MAIGFVLVVGQYLICALVAPDFADGDGFDLRRFHDHQDRTYLGGFLALVVFAILVNIAADVGAGIKGEANQNGLILGMIPPLVAALLVRTAWVQVVAPWVILTLGVANVMIYYPALQ